MSNDYIRVKSPAVTDIAARLESFSNEVRSYDEQLLKGLMRLSNSYRGEGYDRFGLKFEAARKRIREFLEHTATTVSQLKLDAERLAAFERLSKE